MRLLRPSGAVSGSGRVPTAKPSLVGGVEPVEVEPDSSSATPRPIAGAKSPWHQRTEEMPVLDRRLTARSIANATADDGFA
jgi:hypothetical protein